MSIKRNDLLLATLQRAGKPLASDDLLDGACGLALDAGWDPAQSAELTRKVIAQLLKHLVARGVVRVAGSKFDEGARRSTPTYEPTKGYDPHALIPTGPTPPTRVDPNSTFNAMNRAQVIAVLDAQDEMLSKFAGGLAGLQAFLTGFMATREKVRARLVAVGLGDH